MPFGLGMTETLLIFAVLLLFFGAKRLPELAGGLGKGIRDFKRSLNGLDDAALQSNQIPQAQPAPQVQAAAPAEETKVS
jgi:sec-independent protein translocase protein TatA